MKENLNVKLAAGAFTLLLALPAMLVAQFWAPAWWPQYQHDAQRTGCSPLAGQFFDSTSVEVVWQAFDSSVSSARSGGALVPLEGAGPSVDIVFGHAVGYEWDSSIVSLAAWDGTCAWSNHFSSNFNTGHDTPAVADLDGDGELEAVFAGTYKDFNTPDSANPGQVLIFTVSKGMNYLEYGDWIISFGYSPLVVDLDGDGKLEIVVVTYRGMVYCYGATGRNTYARLWEFDLQANVGWPYQCYSMVGPAAGDVDGDGEMEVVITTSPPAYDYVTPSDIVCINADGTLMRRIGLPVIDRSLYTSPALGDLDGDGVMEIVALSWNDPTLYAVRGDGTLMWKYHWGDFIRRGDTAPVLGDLDNDGLPDVVFQASRYYTGDNSFIALRGVNGALLGRLTRGGENSVLTLALFDADDDGQLDIFAGTNNDGVIVLDGGDRYLRPKWKLRRNWSAGMVQQLPLGDVDGDGYAEIVVLTSAGGNPNILVLDNPYTGVGEGGAKGDVPYIRTSPSVFARGTEVSFAAPGVGAVRVTVFSASGRRVKKLYAGTASDLTKLSWDGRDDAGMTLPAGTYVIVLQGKGKTLTTTVVKTKGR